MKLFDVVRIKNHCLLIEDLKGCKARIIRKASPHSFDVLVLDGRRKNCKFTLLETLLETIEYKEKVIFT